MNTIFAIAIAVAPSDQTTLKIIGGALVFLLVFIVARALFRPMTPETVLPHISSTGMLTSNLIEKVKGEHLLVTSEEIEKILQTLERDGFIETARSHQHHKMVRITNAGVDYLRERAQED